MDITLNEKEIEAAVKSWVKEQGLSFGDMEPQVAISNTRGVITAAITITRDVDIELAGATITKLAGKEKDMEVFKEPVVKKAKKTVEESKDLFATTSTSKTETVVVDEPLEEEVPVVESLPVTSTDELFS